MSDIPDVTREFIWCRSRERSLPLTNCIKCNKYPCIDLDDKYTFMLEHSEAISHTLQDIPYTVRRIRMQYIFRNKETGEYKEPPAEFNIDNITNFSSEFVSEIEQYEILCVTKVLVPQVKLVLKSKEDRVSENTEPKQRRKRNG